MGKEDNLRVVSTVDFKVSAENEVLGRIYIPVGNGVSNGYTVKVNHYGNLVMDHMDNHIEATSIEDIAIGSCKISYYHCGDDFISVTVYDTEVDKCKK